MALVKFSSKGQPSLPSQSRLFLPFAHLRYSSKHAVLFLYRRIFPSKRFRNVLFGIAFLVTGWLFPSFLGTVLMCVPIRSNWDPNIKGACIDYGKGTLSMGIVNVLLDFIILGAPMPLLWKLQMSVRRKIMLSCAFAVGGMLVYSSHLLLLCFTLR